MTPELRNSFKFSHTSNINFLQWKFHHQTMWATAVCAAVVIAASRGVTNQLGRSKRQATTTTTKPTIARTCASFKYQEECDDKAPASLNCAWTSAEAGDFEGIRVCKEMSCEQITYVFVVHSLLSLALPPPILCLSVFVLTCEHTYLA